MSKNGTSLSAINKKATVIWICLVATIIFIISGWAWVHSVYLSSNNVFWGMLNNNLATTSVTGHIIQTGQGQSLDQYTQKQFGAENLAHSLITLKQTGGVADATVRSETIGTPTADYSRYLSIESQQRTAKGKPIDTSNLIGVWAKADIKNSQTVSSQSFRQSLLGIVPFANLNSQQRRNIIQLMRDKNVYDISKSPVKSEVVNGRQAFVYDVTINPQGYLDVTIQVIKDMGLGDIGLNSSQYDNSPNFKAQFTVDKLSRQLIKISYPASGQQVTFSSQGLEQAVTLPTQTITMTELQKRIQAGVR